MESTVDRIMAKILILSVCFIALATGASIKSTFLPVLSRAGKIVGGHQIDITEAPYQVSLRLFNNHHCGGSIISDRWVLTAAHCTEGVLDPAKYEIRVGSSSRSKGGQLLDIKSIHPHPEYDRDTIQFDVCLVELSESLQFNESVRSISLTEQEPSAGSASLVSGWGATQSQEESNELLRAVVVPVVNRTECAEAYDGGYDITESMICAGYPKEGGKDSCQGDSGGPMVVDEQLAGVVSWGKGCALPGYPGVYANVAVVRSWIREVANV